MYKYVQLLLLTFATGFLDNAYCSINHPFKPERIAFFRETLKKADLKNAATIPIMRTTRIPSALSTLCGLQINDHWLKQYTKEQQEYVILWMAHSFKLIPSNVLKISLATLLNLYVMILPQVYIDRNYDKSVKKINNKQLRTLLKHKIAKTSIRVIAGLISYAICNIIYKNINHKLSLDKDKAAINIQKTAVPALGFFAKTIEKRDNAVVTLNKSFCEKVEKFLWRRLYNTHHMSLEKEREHAIEFALKNNIPIV